MNVQLGCVHLVLMSVMIVLYYQLLLQYVVLTSNFSWREEKETQLLPELERTKRKECSKMLDVYS